MLLGCPCRNRQGFFSESFCQTHKKIYICISNKPKKTGTMENFILVTSDDNMPKTHTVTKEGYVDMLDSHGDFTKDLSLTPVFEHSKDNPELRKQYFSQVWGVEFEVYSF